MEAKIAAYVAVSITVACAVLGCLYALEREESDAKTAIHTVVCGTIGFLGGIILSLLLLLLYKSAYGIMEYLM